MSEIIKYRQSGSSAYEIQELSLKDFYADVKAKLFTEEDSKRLKLEAERILAEAKIKVEKMIRDAEEETKTLIVLAEKKVEDFRKEGLRQGYEEGLQKAEAEMEEKYSRLFEQEADQLRAFLQALKDSYKDAIKTAERPLAMLALEIAEKVIREEAQKNSEVILKNIREALLKLSNKAQVIVRVNPAQFKLVDSHKEKLVRAVEGLDGFELKQDPKVDMGGCIIETPSGSVEARIEKQIKEVRKVITGQDREELDVSGNT